MLCLTRRSVLRCCPHSLVRMSRIVENGSKAAPSVMKKKTWLDSFASVHRDMEPRKRKVPQQETFEQCQRRHLEQQQKEYEQQRAIWAREGVFWCKNTETWEVRRDGQPNQPVSGHWFHNKNKGVLELYNDVRQDPVQTKDVVFFKK